MKVGWNSRSYIEPEVQFGNIVGHAFDNPVLIIKAGTGNRALGWDFLSIGSDRYEYYDEANGDRLSYPGHGECPKSSLHDSTQADAGDCNLCDWNIFDCPMFFASENDCLSSYGIGWYTGLQFDEDLQNVKTILNNIKHYYPGYNDQGFEISRFVFWQGKRYMNKAAHASQYAININTFIHNLSESYNEYPGPKKFVHATVTFGGYHPYDEDELCPWI